MTAGFPLLPGLTLRQIPSRFGPSLEKPGNWMVAPQSVILELSHYRPLFISELKNTPPNRVCYKIKHKYPKSTSKRAVEFFENALEDFLAESTPSFPIGQVWERQK